MSEDFNMVAPKKVLIMTRVPLIIQLPGNQTQNFERVQTQSSAKLNSVEDFWEKFKGSQDQSYFIFEINVGKGRIRHRTTLNDAIFKRFGTF